MDRLQSLLPKSLEDVCRNIASYFHLSPLRTKNFQEFQEFFDIEKHQLPNAGQTSGIPVLYLLESELKALLTSLLSDFMKVSFIRQADPWLIDINDQEHYVPLNHVYVGPCATDTMQTIKDDLGVDHPVSLLQVYRQLPQLNDVADLQEADNEWQATCTVPQLEWRNEFSGILDSCF
ncbi:Hypothetical predicted protein [Paramuricea clavata]|uniref:Uncharacterized protein n=1 Tax=Paramuricea clavata TaxID=317549 RepID=A0A6S7IX83_PARCT|nr:Hypothetical predicted protein [Paramuricea clavata]